MAHYRGVEYKPDAGGVAEEVRCPLVDTWISPVDCMENQSITEKSIPARFKTKQNWKTICLQCPFRDY